jgi:phage nucleotide-binding protein
VTTELIRPGYLAGLPIIKAKHSRPFINILIYGKSGVGKTRLAGSSDDVPSMRKVLVIDVEGGAMTLAHTYPDVDVVRVKDWNDVANIYDILESGNHDYSTVIIDSLTEAQKFNMNAVMIKRIAEREAKGDVQDPDVPDMRAWGKNIEQMRRFVRAFRDLEMNTIFTALVKEEKNPRTGVIEKMPSLSGKLAGEVAAFLDIVVYFYMKEFDDEQKRIIITQATDEVVAKDRTGKLPLLLEFPTMGEIMKYTVVSETLMSETLMSETIHVPETTEMETTNVE